MNLLHLDDETFKSEEEGALMVQKTLRSGQVIRHEGSVVVVGDVNPGAEVIAGGNVIVFGALRGVVHAGAFGDANSVVIAFHLKPTQLRIADFITRPPDNDIKNTDKPEIASIRNNTVVIESLKLS